MTVLEVKCDGCCRECMISYVKKDDDDIEIFACKAEDNPEIKVIVEDPFEEMIEEEEDRRAKSFSGSQANSQ